MSNAEKPLSLTPCDLVVLVTIAAKPRHGYDLWKQLEAADVKDWAPVSKPQIYYSLRKLQTSALISERPEDGKPAGPKKEVYAITRKGRGALKKNLAEPYWAENRDPPPFTTWAALSLALPVEDKIAQVQRRRDFLQGELCREQATMIELEQYEVETADLARSLISLAINQFKTELAWLDKFEKSIKAKR
ncbi:MAG: PadR family transcriptional regulator [Hyphococcus sp.]|nr:MAG: PadR family transcriptional regulator [Marinicaulis sp.]